MNTADTEYLHNNIVDALAIWEAAIDSPPVYLWLTNDDGAVQGRCNAVEITPILGRAYDYADSSFDWDFLPAFFDILLDTDCIPETPCVSELTQELANEIVARIDVGNVRPYQPNPTEQPVAT